MVPGDLPQTRHESSPRYIYFTSGSFSSCNIAVFIKKGLSCIGVHTKFGKLKFTRDFASLALDLAFGAFLMLSQGPLLLDSFLGAKMTSMLKIRIFSKSSFGVNVKVNISHQKFFL